MPDRIDLFRMVHHANVAHILDHGLCNRRHSDLDHAMWEGVALARLRPPSARPQTVGSATTAMVPKHTMG